MCNVAEYQIWLSASFDTGQAREAKRLPTRAVHSEPPTAVPVPDLPDLQISLMHYLAENLPEDAIIGELFQMRLY